MPTDNTQNQISEPTLTPELYIEPHSEAVVSVLDSIPVPVPAESTQEQELVPQVVKVSTAHIPVNEPLIVVEQEQAKPAPATNSVQTSTAPAPSVVASLARMSRELLVKARSALQTRKRKKLNKVMTLFERQTKITNDEVEKLLHISDATATRYLSVLEKENKIKQEGRTGHAVSYSKI